MPHTHVVEGHTYAEFKVGVKELYDAHFPVRSVLGQPPQAASASNEAPVKEAPVKEAPAEVAAPAKKGKKSAEKELRTSVAASELDEQGEEIASKEIDPFAEDEALVTKEDITAALMKVKTTVSLKAATDIFKKFGADRISEIREGDYASVIAECNKALGK